MKLQRLDGMHHYSLIICPVDQNCDLNMISNKEPHDLCTVRGE